MYYGFSAQEKDKVRDQGREAYSNRTEVRPTRDVARVVHAEEETESTPRTCKEQNLDPCTLLDSLKEEELVMQDKAIAASAKNNGPGRSMTSIAKLENPTGNPSGSPIGF